MTLFHGLGPFAASGIAAGDFDFITSASGTAQASISVENCFSADYSLYLVMRNLLGSVGDSDIAARLRVGGADASAAQYRYQQLSASSTTVGGARSTGGTSWAAFLGFTETAAFGFQRTWVSNPFEAVRTTAWNDWSIDADGNIAAYSHVFEHDAETSYTGLTVFPGSGTLTGSIYVWGVRN